MDISKAKTIAGWMLFEEMEWLATQAENHAIIVEIGSFLGRSTRALADNTNGVVFALDSWIGPVGANTKPLAPELNVLSASGEYTEEEKKHFSAQFISNLLDHITAGKVVPVKCEHENAGQIDLRPDMVFIDGDHSYSAVRRDIKIWWNKLQPGGLICGHDASQSQVRKAVTDTFPDAKFVSNTTIWYKEKD